MEEIVRRGPGRPPKLAALTPADAIATMTRGRTVTVLKLNRAQQLKFQQQPKYTFSKSVDKLEMWENEHQTALEVLLETGNVKIFPLANVESYEVEP